MDNETKEQKVYTLEEVADMWNISVRAVKEMVATGGVNGVHCKKEDIKGFTSYA